MTSNQNKALAALLTCKSRTEAARACGLSTKTLQGYEKLPEFADALERGRREALADAAHRISAGYSLTPWTPCRPSYRMTAQQTRPAWPLPAPC